MSWCAQQDCASFDISRGHLVATCALCCCRWHGVLLRSGRSHLVRGLGPRRNGEGQDQSEHFVSHDCSLLDAMNFCVRAYTRFLQADRWRRRSLSASQMDCAFGVAEGLRRVAQCFARSRAEGGCDQSTWLRRENVLRDVDRRLPTERRPSQDASCFSPLAAPQNFAALVARSTDADYTVLQQGLAQRREVVQTANDLPDSRSDRAWREQWGTPSAPLPFVEKRRARKARSTVQAKPIQPRR